MVKTYTSKNSAKLSMFFNESGDFELDKREVITSLRSTTQEVAKKAVVESKEIKEYNQFNDIEKQLEQFGRDEDEKLVKDSNVKKTELDSNNNQPTPLSIISPSASSVSENKQEEPVQKTTDSKNNKIAVSIQELFIDTEGNEVLTRNSTGTAIIGLDEAVVTIRHNLERDFEYDESVKDKLLSELPDLTTYIASNGRVMFDVAKEKERLSYEILSNINRFRFLSGLKSVEKNSSFVFDTSFQIKAEAKSTMPYLTVREVADLFFKQILIEQHPKLLMDVDSIGINIGKITVSETKQHIVASIYKDVHTVTAEVMIHLGNKRKDKPQT